MPRKPKKKNKTPSPTSQNDTISPRRSPRLAKQNNNNNQNNNNKARKRKRNKLAIKNKSLQISRVDRDDDDDDDDNNNNNPSNNSKSNVAKSSTNYFNQLRKPPVIESKKFKLLVKDDESIKLYVQEQIGYLKEKEEFIKSNDPAKFNTQQWKDRKRARIMLDNLKTSWLCPFYQRHTKFADLDPKRWDATELIIKNKIEEIHRYRLKISKTNKKTGNIHLSVPKGLFSDADNDDDIDIDIDIGNDNDVDADLDDYSDDDDMNQSILHDEITIYKP